MAERPSVADPAQVVKAAEQALVRAEDSAGHVPRSVVIGVPAAECVLAGSAREAGHILTAQRGAAPRLTGLRDGLFADDSALAERRALAEALDLDLGALIAEPLAAEAIAGGEPAIVIDVGGSVTAATVIDRPGARGALTAPIGGAALEGRVVERLDVSPEQARDAVLAHGAGAGGRSSAGPAAGRAVTELARHHADVWLDALETVLSDLARGKALPSRLLLCGGGAALPELREALAGSAWRAALPFDDAPEVRVALPEDAMDGEGVAELGLPAETVIALGIAAAALHPR